MESTMPTFEVPKELVPQEVAEEKEEAIKPTKPKVIVIFPARNEEKTIKQCIETVKKSKYKPSVIVADGHSTDRTREFAEKAGAKVVTSPKRIHPGKGLAMKENPDIVVFMDSDLENIAPEWLDKLVDGIVIDGYEMVRASYYRPPVTKLVAKRLPWVFFPRFPTRPTSSWGSCCKGRDLEGASQTRSARWAGYRCGH